MNILAFLYYLTVCGDFDQVQEFTRRILFEIAFCLPLLMAFYNIKVVYHHSYVSLSISMGQLSNV